MGVDWFRFKQKDNTDISLTKELVDRQAKSYQSLWGWDSNFDRDRISSNLLKKIHLQTYLEASRELKSLLEFPEWNEELGCAEDIPDLDPCMRVYPITSWAIFPPLWRVMDCKTYLPEELAIQFEKWQNWIKEVKSDRHDEYLRELHLYQTLNTFREHLDILKIYAIASLQKENNWTKKADLQITRQKILELNQVECIEIRLDPLQSIKERSQNFDSIYKEIFDYIPEVIQLTRAWDSNVRGNWKVNYYEDRYNLNLAEFKNSYLDDDWLEIFLNWVERLVVYGFGLYLDY